MAEDLMTALRALANRWAMKARDFARSAKESGTSESQASYDRGFAEGYYRAATELAAVLKEHEAGQDPQAKPVSSAPSAGASPPRNAVPAPQPAAPKPAAPKPPPAPNYMSVTVGEAISILVFAGCQPRDVIQNKDNSLRATFSSWGSLMLHEQVDRVKNADPRIIILNNGKLESHDYFIEFAFKEN